MEIGTRLGTRCIGFNCNKVKPIGAAYGLGTFKMCMKMSILVDIDAIIDGYLPERAMTTTLISIADARSQFPSIVQRAERGDTVRITRRGAPVAVLLSEGEYARLTQARPLLADVLDAWRSDMRQAGAAFLAPDEFADLRERRHGDRSEPDLTAGQA